MPIGLFRGTYTAAGIVGANRTPSGQTPAAPGSSGARYLDPITEKVYTADSPDELMTLLEAQNVNLVSRNELYEASRVRKEMDGDMRAARSAEPKEWTQGIIELNGYADPQQVADIVTRVLENPDLHAVLNKSSQVAGNQFPALDVVGKRGVITWPVHYNQQRVPHVQIFVHDYAVRHVDANGNRLEKPEVQQASSLNTASIRDLVETQVNAELNRLGLAPIKFISEGQSPNAQVAVQSRQAVQQATLTGQPLPVPVAPANVSMNDAQAILTARGLQADRDAAALTAQAQAKIDEGAFFKRAVQAIDEARNAQNELVTEQGLRTAAEQREQAALGTVTTLEGEVATLKGDRDGLATKLEVEQVKHGETRGLLNDAEKARDEFKKERDELDGLLTAETEEHTKTRDLLNGVKDDLDGVRRELEVEKKAREGAEAQKSAEHSLRVQAEAELKDERKAKEEAEAMNRQIIEENRRQAQELAELREAAQQLRTQLAVSQAEAAAKDGQLVEVKGERNQAREALESERKAHEATRGIATTATAERDQARGALESERTAHGVTRATLEDTKRAFDTSQGTIEALQRALTAPTPTPPAPDAPGDDDTPEPAKPRTPR